MDEHELSNINISFISLVKEGANGKQFIYKTATDTPSLQKTVDVMKYDDEKGIVYGVVYAPDQVDSQGDYASASEIEKAAHGFMRTLSLHNIDVDHSFEKEAAYVVESWILKAGDETFPDEPVGAWAVAVKLEGEGLRELAKSGELAAFSMAGKSERTKVAKAEGDGAMKKFLTALADASTGMWLEFSTYIEKSNKGELNMDKFAEIVKEKIEASMKEANSAAAVMQKSADDQADALEKQAGKMLALEKQLEEQAVAQKELKSANDALQKTNDEQAEAAELAKTAAEKAAKDSKEANDALTKSMDGMKTAFAEVQEVVKGSKQVGDLKKIQTVVTKNAKVVM